MLVRLQSRFNSADKFQIIPLCSAGQVHRMRPSDSAPPSLFSSKGRIICPDLLYGPNEVAFGGDSVIVPRVLGFQWGHKMTEASKTEIVQGRAAIVTLYRTAQSNDSHNRRFSRRYPFFQPVAVTTADDSLHEFSAFSRDISETGVGLLHIMPLALGRVQLKIETADGLRTFPAKIAWCRPAGDGWYMSGAEFIN